MSYPGSKGQDGVYQRIIGQMPPHSLYVEPFFGSGYVFWEKLRAAASIVMDVVPGCIAKAGAEAGVTAIVGDAISLLPGLAAFFPPDTVVYCDPPYLLQTRRGRRYYEHEMTDEQHVRLLDVLLALRCCVLISGYPSALYASTLQNWRCLDYRTRTRGRTVTECLWCNQAEPAELHDWRYCGKTFRERLGLKRLAARWLARLDRMPSRKRGYILHAVHQRWNGRELPSTNARIGATSRSSPHAGNGAAVPNADFGVATRSLSQTAAFGDRL